MSIDIDYALLSDPSSPFAQALIDTLNAALNSSARPSFLGPVTVAALDFGDAAPDVEIRDVRDLWRAFEEGDEDEDGDEDEVAGGGAYGDVDDGGAGEGEGTTLVDDLDERYVARLGGAHRRAGPGASVGAQSMSMRSNSGSTSGALGMKALVSSARGREPDRPTPVPYAASHVHTAGIGAGRHDARERERERDDDALSVLSAAQSVRSFRSVQAVGIGLHPSLSAASAAGLISPRLLTGSASQPLSLAALAHPGLGLNSHASAHAHGHGSRRALDVPAPAPAPASAAAALARARAHRDARSISYPLRRPDQHTRTHSRLPSPPKATASPPPSPPARPAGLPARESGLPSVQMHVHLSHAANLRLTILTSLQVNYPSKLFMALPLKLSVTGLTLDADLIVAYSGARHRLYISVADDDVPLSTRSSAAGLQSPTTSYASSAGGVFGGGGAGGVGAGGGVGAAGGGGGGGGPIPVGQRIIPHLHIESEIGHADAHVLRNVGKVERFIADVLRKTVVDELVWPNFYTVAL
ncbi:Mitochondrial distribution and morphology protein 12 [Cryptotrichosporon argae]